MGHFNNPLAGGFNTPPPNQLIPGQQPGQLIQPPVGLLPPPVENPLSNFGNQPITTNLTPISAAQAAVVRPTLGGVKPQPSVTNAPIAPIAQPQVIQTPFGLTGGEQAIGQGLQAGLGALQQGQGSALQTLIGGGALAQGQFEQGLGALTSQNQLAQQQIQQSQAQAFQQSQAAQQQGLGAISSGIAAGQAQLSPFAATGGQANQVQAALSGALGNEAQAQAFADFQASPEQAFLREQGELGVINQAAALGGLGGGNVRRELTRFGTGLAAQDFQNRFNRLGSVAGRGATAAGQGAQLAGQGALAQGSLIGSLGGQRASQIAQGGQFGAGLTSQLGAQQLGARQNLGGLFGNLAAQGAGFQQAGGQQAAGLFGQAGQQIGQARIGAGRDIAGNIQSVTQGLSQLASQQGAGLSDILGGGAANIANLLSGSGQFSAQQIQQLLPILANLSTGQATQIGGLTQQAGQAVANANLAATQGGQQLGADVIGGLAGFFSDERLKDDITLIGSDKGINFYSWSWNGKMPVKELIGKKSFGVLAQELGINHPELIIEDESGYKKVDYVGLNKLWQH